MTDCNVIRDLMLLSESGEASQASQALVDEHAAACEACRTYRQQLRQEAQTIPIQPLAPLGKMRQRLHRRQVYTALLWALVAVLALTTAFAWLTRPIYLSWDTVQLEIYGTDRADSVDSDSASSEDPATYFAKSAFVAASRASGATRLGVRYHRDAYGAPEAVEVTAWTTLLDRLTGRSFAVAPIEMPLLSSAYYLDYTTGEAVQMANGDGWTHSDAFLMLPRLTLGYYAAIAGAAAAMLALLWLILRRRRVGRVLPYALLAPLCYLAAHLATMGLQTMTFDLARDLSLILLDGLALYGIAFSLVRLRREKRGRDG